MGPCKAALRSLNGYLARGPGTMGVRADLVVAGTASDTGHLGHPRLRGSRGPLVAPGTPGLGTDGRICGGRRPRTDIRAPARAAPGSGCGGLARSGRYKAGDELEQLADAVGLFYGVAQRLVEVDLVMVATADPGSFHVAVPHEIGDDRLSGALGDPYPGGNVSTADAGVAGDADQHMAVVGEERPARLRRVLGCAIGVVHALKGSRLRETPNRFGCLSARPHDLRRAHVRATIHDVAFVYSRGGTPLKRGWNGLAGEGR